MRNKTSFLSTLILSALISVPSVADVMEDFDSLGGNDVLLEKAQSVRPETRVQIVQDRIVDRSNRHELSLGTSQTVGGYSYLHSNAVGASYQYHITPRWSIGANYSHYFNSLNPEGEALINKYDELTAGQDTDMAFVPELDWPLASYMAMASWYPIYGKMNLHNLGILHFDVYLMGGYGQVQLEKSGETQTWTGGGGLAMWFSQHLTGRLEVRYQTYAVDSFTGSKALDLTAIGFNMGYML